MKTSASVVLDKALALFHTIIADAGEHSLRAIADDLGLPQATAYRLAATLKERGLLVSCGEGRYLPGPRMIAAITRIDPKTVMSRVAKPVLARLSRQLGQLVQMGVLEGGMVTYLVKSGAGGASHFTREGMQLEAYGSGLGKVLLSHLPAEDLRAYLAGGPFVRLTTQTLIDPRLLENHLETVRAQGYALDEREVAEDLKCVAVPVKDDAGQVVAAISLSGSPDQLSDARLARLRSSLQAAAVNIQLKLFGSRN